MCLNVLVNRHAVMMRSVYMAGIIPYEAGDIVEMKKKHPCGSYEWELLKVGADIKMRCLGCNHEVILKRSLVQKNTKKVKKTCN